MSETFNPESASSFFKEHLNNTLLPFWLNNSIDTEYGGFYTCFENKGDRLLSTDKYTWSQGRMVWVFSKLSSMEMYSGEQRRKFLEMAGSGAEFLMKNCLLPNGNCTFVMERNGTPKPEIPGGACDTSFYADCFVVLGLAKHALVSHDRSSYEFAKKLYLSIAERLDSGTFKSEPYPAPQGYKMHGPPMIMLNISNEIAQTAREFNDGWENYADSRADSCMEEILGTFVDSGFALHEMVCTDKRFDFESLAGRYVNPGHTIEDMWFVIHQALHKDRRDIIEKAAKIVKKAFEVGWDEEFGGLMLFADFEGGRPKGSIKGFEKDKMVGKVLNDWSSKLWWPHSEALYTTLLTYVLTGDRELLELYRKAFGYVFRTFPNEDASIGEWIQIRDREGRPEEKVVALPVKDPFHIIRNMILAIELLDGTGRTAS